MMYADSSLTNTMRNEGGSSFAPAILASNFNFAGISDAM